MEETKKTPNADRPSRLSKLKSATIEAGKSRTLPGRDEAEAIEYGRQFLNIVARIKGVRVDRQQFLIAELRREGIAHTQAQAAAATSPAAAEVPDEVVTKIARRVINFETNKSTALSFVAGLPGGFALLGTVPGDLTQYFVHSFRIMQKLAYLYGWQEFLEDSKELDDESLAQLALFLGTMIGVGGASNGLVAFAHQVAGPAVQKRIARAALTKTFYYPVVKKCLQMVGVKVTKDTFAKGVSKAVPVVGGVLSGATTYASLKPGALRLMKQLAELPQANSTDRSTH